jgi:hypothetical protein
MLGELPEGWTWAGLDQLLSLSRNGIPAKPDAESGLPILRISAVRALSVNVAEARICFAFPPPVFYPIAIAASRPADWFQCRGPDALRDPDAASSMAG